MQILFVVFIVDIFKFKKIATKIAMTITQIRFLRIYSKISAEMRSTGTLKIMCHIIFWISRQVRAHCE